MTTTFFHKKEEKVQTSVTLCLKEGITFIFPMKACIDYVLNLHNL